MGGYCKSLHQELFFLFPICWSLWLSPGPGVGGPELEGEPCEVVGVQQSRRTVGLISPHGRANQNVNGHFLLSPKTLNKAVNMLPACLCVTKYHAEIYLLRCRVVVGCEWQTPEDAHGELCRHTKQ